MAATGRQRAKTNKFWATAISRMDSNVATIVRRLDDLIQRSPELAPYMWMGSGFRTGSKEHGSGRAIDVIFTEDVGRKATAAEKRAGRLFADFLIKNGKILGVQWVLLSIDDKVTWSYNMDRGSWVKLADRGSVPGNHRDHVHILFKKTARWVTSLAGSVIGSAGVKPPITQPAPVVWDGKTFPGVTVFRNGLASAATKVVQERLKAHGYDPGAVDSYWGPKTQAATKRFQEAQNWHGDDADGIPGRVTWSRLLEAPKPATVPAAKSISQMASEVIAGKHGNGHETRRKSLGVSLAVYEKVRAEVNRRV